MLIYLRNLGRGISSAQKLQAANFTKALDLGVANLVPDLQLMAKYYFSLHLCSLLILQKDMPAKFSKLKTILLGKGATI